MFAKHTIVVIVVALFCGLFLWSGSAQAAKPLGKLLYLPIVAGPNVDSDDLEKIDQILSERMKKFIKFDVYTLNGFEDKYGRKKARRLMQCGVDLGCIDKRLRRADYQLVVLGEAKKHGKSRIKVSFKVYNLLDGKVKKDETFKVSVRKFADNPYARKWTIALLTPPESLLSKEEEPEPELFEDEEEPEPEPKHVRKPERKSRKKSRSSRLASEKSVRSGIKAAYLSFVSGDINEAIGKIKDVTQRRCGCDADGKAFGMKAMMEAFAVADAKVDKAMKQGDSRTIIGNLEEMRTLEGELQEEGQRLGVEKKSRYADEMNSKFAKGYALQGKGQMKQQNYLDARDSFNKALEYDPNDAEAKELLAKIPQQAKQLYMQATYMADYAPEEAKKKLEQVLELVSQDDPLYEDAQEKLQDIEDME